MHIPDGYLGPVTYGGLWAAMVPIWIYASKKVKKGLETAQVPFLAMASVFSLVAMVFAIPLPGGTTGHLNGSTLIAILLGPWAAIIAVSIGLVIQALVFGEGGITTLAANCFNIAVIGATTGFVIYTLITRIGLKFVKESPSHSTLRLIGAGIASYISLNLGGLFTSVQLGLQPLLHPATSFYFPFPLKIVVPAVMIPHLTILGLIEVTVTVLVLLFLLKSQPDLLNRLKKSSILLPAILLLLLPSSSFAHDFWIEKKGSEWMVVFGHGTRREEFDPSKVKIVKTFDLQGIELKVDREKRGTGLLLKMESPPSLLFAEIDNGYWSKTIYGWKNLPKTKASRVVESNRSFYYTKALYSWNETAQKALSDSKFDIVPLENPSGLRPGALMPIKVFYQGKSMPGLEIEGGDHQRLATTDKDGMARVPITGGHQLLSVRMKEPVKNDPDADYLSIVSTLTFEVTK